MVLQHFDFVKQSLVLCLHLGSDSFLLAQFLLHVLNGLLLVDAYLIRTLLRVEEHFQLVSHLGNGFVQRDVLLLESHLFLHGSLRLRYVGLVAVRQILVLILE